MWLDRSLYLLCKTVETDLYSKYWAQSTLKADYCLMTLDMPILHLLGSSCEKRAWRIPYFLDETVRNFIWNQYIHRYGRNDGRSQFGAAEIAACFTRSATEKKNVQDKRLSPRIPSQSAKNCWRVAVYFDLIGLFIYHFQDNCHFKISFFFKLIHTYYFLYATISSTY